MKFSVGAFSDVGRSRDHNEDAYVVDERLVLFAIADGMGGHRGGEVATELACDTLARVFDHHPIEGLVSAIEQAATCDIVASPETAPACAFLKPIPGPVDAGPDVPADDATDLDAPETSEGG